MKLLLRWILKIDAIAYTSYIAEIEKGNLRSFRSVCSWIGLPIPLFSMLALISIIGYQYSGYKAVIIVIISYITSSFINLIIKAIYKRDRPPNNNFWSPIPFDKYSFPSGHAAGTMAVAICLSYLIPSISMPLLCWSMIIGISRFFGDFHHPTDIAAGFIVGIVSGLLLISIIPMFI